MMPTTLIREKPVEPAVRIAPDTAVPSARS